MQDMKQGEEEDLMDKGMRKEIQRIREANNCSFRINGFEPEWRVDDYDHEGALAW